MAREPKVEDDGTCYLSFRVKVEPSLLYDVERLRVSIGREQGMWVSKTQLLMKCVRIGINELKECYDE